MYYQGVEKSRIPNRRSHPCRFLNRTTSRFDMHRNKHRAAKYHTPGPRNRPCRLRNCTSSGTDSYRNKHRAAKCRIPRLRNPPHRVRNCTSSGTDRYRKRIQLKVICHILDHRSHSRRFQSYTTRSHPGCNFRSIAHGGLHRIQVRRSRFHMIPGCTSPMICSNRR